MSGEKDSKTIEELLSDYQKERKLEDNKIEELTPPIRREKASDNDTDKKENKKQNKSKDKISDSIQSLLLKIKKIKINKNIFKNKKLIISAVSVIAAVLIVVVALSVSSSNAQKRALLKTAYLRPYIQKYPEVEFPEGILEEYCDSYGKSPDLRCHIEISDISLDKLIYEKDCRMAGSQTFNYVVYLDNNELEAFYNTAEAYNSSSKQISFSNLFDNYTFQVVGAFYINTNPKDDNGYVFPYDTCKKLEMYDANYLIEGLENRMLYKASGLDLTRVDTLLTISCPTDYRENYRFVIVAKAVEETDTNATAKQNPSPHLTDVEYKEMGIDNPYRFAKKWQPKQ